MVCGLTCPHSPHLAARVGGVKKLFLQVVPVVSLYTLYTSTQLKPQALTRDHETRRI
ncbi:MAG: hypothetical protein II863_16245 [Kiritimatiellae bacterium]|nr:hypothetical protein [Kiritimatiellia bacterium]